MIQFQFTLHRSRSPDFRSYFEFTKSLSKNKTFEFQMHNDSNLLHVLFDIKFGGCDHAGPVVELGLLGVRAVIRVYDKRHWDYTLHKWEEHDSSY